MLLVVAEQVKPTSNVGGLTFHELSAVLDAPLKATIRVPSMRPFSSELITLDKRQRARQLKARNSAISAQVAQVQWHSGSEQTMQVMATCPQKLRDALPPWPCEQPGGLCG